MKKLLEGIVDFRRTARPEMRRQFAALALGQKPDALFIACADSRVVPNLFVSTNPGDLFVTRNVGNLVPPWNPEDSTDVSEGAALEFSVRALNVRNIVVCGHSECGAMKAGLTGKLPPDSPHLARWLRYVEPAVRQHRAGRTLDSTLTEHNQLSQLNVLTQVEHVLSHPSVREGVEAGTLAVHAWWFDIGHADVYAYEKDDGFFVLLDETEANRIMERLP